MKLIFKKKYKGLLSLFRTHFCLCKREGGPLSHFFRVFLQNCQKFWALRIDRGTTHRAIKVVHRGEKAVLKSTTLRTEGSALHTGCSATHRPSSGLTCPPFNGATHREHPTQPDVSHREGLTGTTSQVALRTEEFCPDLPKSGQNHFFLLRFSLGSCIKFGKVGGHSSLPSKVFYLHP